MPRSPLMHAHAALWLAAGVSAAAYLGWTLTGAGGSPDAGIAAHRSRLTDDVATSGIGRALVQLSQDVRAVQDRLTTGEEQTQAVLGRLSSLEEKSALATSGAQAAAPAPAPGRDTSRNDPSRDAAPITTGAILQRVAAPSDATKPDAAPQAAAPLPAPPKAVHAVQLSSGTNLDALRLNWSLLSERHRQLLGSFQTRYRQTPGKPNAPYQLIAGPVRSTAEAARICKELATSGVACRATTFSGEAL